MDEIVEIFKDTQNVLDSFLTVNLELLTKIVNATPETSLKKCSNVYVAGSDSEVRII